MKIFIFGPPGGGKTTLARKLSKELNIEHFELDSHFFKFEQGISPDPDKRKALVASILANENWIIEGMYRDDWVDEILKEADHIFILIPPRPLTFFRLSGRTIKRIVKFEKHERKSDFSVLAYLLSIVHNFEERNLEISDRSKKLGKEVFTAKWKKEIINHLKIKR